MAIETSYDTKYGSGDRRGIIDIKYEYNNLPVDLSFLVDGQRNKSYRFKDEEYTQINFKKPILINEIKFINENTGTYFTNIVEIEVTDEKGNTVNVPNTNSSDKSEMKTSFPLVNAKSIRFRVANSNSPMSISEIEFKTELDPPKKILIKKDNQYGYYTDSFQSLGTTYPTKEQFEQYGMSVLSILEAGDIPVEYEMELISETEEEKCFSYSFDLNGQHKNMKSIDGIITE